MVIIMKKSNITQKALETFIRDNAKSGKTQKAAAEELGVSISTFRKALADYKFNKITSQIDAVTLQTNDRVAIKNFDHKMPVERESKRNVLRKLLIIQPDIEPKEAQKLVEKIAVTRGMKRCKWNSLETFKSSCAYVRKELASGAVSAVS